MAKSALFAKLKGFGPLIVIGTAIAVTIKLLTTTTPTIQDDLSVDAKEDISLTQYQDEIVIPPPPKEEPAPTEEKKEEPTEAEKQPKDEEEEAEEETESEGDSQKEEEKANEQQQKEEKEKPKSSRAWITDPKNVVAGMLKRLFTPKEEK